MESRVSVLYTGRRPSTNRTPAATKSDAELVADLHRSNGDALDALLRRYARLVHRVAANILRDPTEAEDITQEVFFEISRKAHLYDPCRGSVKGWLLQYAYHRTLRRKSDLQRRAAYRGEPIELLEIRVDRTLARQPLLSRQERRWLLCAGLEQLPERQRRTLELVCLEELTLRDVADRLRISLGCARHYYYRGLARLRSWAARVGATAGPRTRSRGAPRSPARGQGAAARACTTDAARAQARRPRAAD
jgi:RNA polymerase sigma-70 factor (ECF subfamily)